MWEGRGGLLIHSHQVFFHHKSGPGSLRIFSWKAAGRIDLHSRVLLFAGGDSGLRRVPHRDSGRRCCLVLALQHELAGCSMVAMHGRARLGVDLSYMVKNAGDPATYPAERVIMWIGGERSWVFQEKTEWGCALV
uniref:Uncharacterized protein n=1 Tax=Aegilops tauschii subsp. strangulata TaxID=200361 RepID=A0A453DXT2_AEGTS